MEECEEEVFFPLLPPEVFTIYLHVTTTTSPSLILQLQSPDYQTAEIEDVDIPQELKTLRLISCKHRLIFHFWLRGGLSYHTLEGSDR